MSFTKSAKAKIVICTILVFFLLACRISVYNQFNKDGSGEFRMSFVITYDDLIALVSSYGLDDEMDDEEILDYLLESMDLDTLDELCAEMETEMGSEYSEFYVESKETSDGVECVIGVPFASINEYVEMQESEDLEVSIDSRGNFTYRMAADIASEDLGDWSTYQEDLDIELVFLWHVTAPGKITYHNGSRVIGNTVTWNLLELVEERNFVMEVRSVVSDSDSDPSDAPASTPRSRATSTSLVTPTITLDITPTFTPIPTLTYTRFPTTTFTSTPEPTYTPMPEPIDTAKPEPTARTASDVSSKEKKDEDKEGGLNIQTVLIIGLVVIVGIIGFQVIQLIRNSSLEE